MIRVLQICYDLFKSNGVASVIMQYYKHIDRNKIQFDFIKFGHREKNKEETHEVEALSLGAKIFYFTKETNLIRLYKQFDIFFKIYASNYEIIHLHVPILANIIFPLAERYGIKCRIIHSHNPKLSDNFLKNIRNELLCYNINSKATQFMACSMESGKYLFGEEICNSNKNFRILYNAIDTKKFKFSEEKRNKIRNLLNLDNYLVVGHIGRFVIQKNHIFLLNIFKQVISRNPKSKLLLLGFGPTEKLIRKQLDKMGLKDSVIILNSNYEVSDLMCAMDVFCLPSLFEGLGIVSIEAQFNGLPIVCSDKLPKESFISNIIRYLSLSESYDEWANCILNNYVDRQTFKVEYNINAENYDINIVARRLEHYYLDFIEI